METKPALSDLSPETRLLLKIQEAPFDDLERLLARLSQVDDAKTLLVFSSISRAPKEAEADFLASAAFWASLTSYRRDGEEPQDDFGGRLDEIIFLLDRVRDELMRLIPSTKRALRAPQQGVVVARAWTGLLLALDAVPTADLPAIIAYSPVSMSSCDPVGDAQMWAEDYHEGTDELPRMLPPRLALVASTTDQPSIIDLPPPVAPRRPARPKHPGRARLESDLAAVMPSLF